MNRLATPEHNLKSIPPSGNPAPLKKANPQNQALGLMKSWIKKLPFFFQMDYARRKIYESPLFDFSVRPLAENLQDWPRALVLDITNRCNAKCSWCPQPQLDELGAMNMSLYRKIIDDYQARGGAIRFGTFGEPLMDKTFAEKISYLKQFPSITKVELVTNGFFLNDKNASLLIENSVDVEISLDEMEKETFEKIKQMSYDTVRSNVLNFLERNDRANKPVNVNFRVKSSLGRKQTEDHELFKKLTEHLCTIELTPMDEDSITTWAGRFDKVKFYKDHLNSANVIKKHNHKEFNKTNDAPCNQAWKWMVVYWDGRVVLCCVDMFATSALGNLNEQSIKDVWSGPVYTAMRDKMIQRKRFEIPICQNCDLHLGWHNLKDYYGQDGNFLPSRKFIS
jgi:radical SAM protein with 4Fe4S-binding SPASM domain